MKHLTTVPFPLRALWCALFCLAIALSVARANASPPVFNGSVNVPTGGNITNAALASACLGSNSSGLLQAITGCYNVANYGVHPDGTDIVSKMDTLLAAAPAGSTIVFPESGTYSICSATSSTIGGLVQYYSLILANGFVTFIGTPGATLKVCNGLVTNTFVAYTPISTINNNYLSGTMAFRDLTFDGNYSNQTFSGFRTGADYTFFGTLGNIGTPTTATLILDNDTFLNWEKSTGTVGGIGMDTYGFEVQYLSNLTFDTDDNGLWITQSIATDPDYSYATNIRCHNMTTACIYFEGLPSVGGGGSAVVNGVSCINDTLGASANVYCVSVNPLQAMANLTIVNGNSQNIGTPIGTNLSAHEVSSSVFAHWTAENENDCYWFANLDSTDIVSDISADHLTQYASTSCQGDIEFNNVTSSATVQASNLISNNSKTFGIALTDGKARISSMSVLNPTSGVIYFGVGAQLAATPACSASSGLPCAGQTSCSLSAATNCSATVIALPSASAHCVANLDSTSAGALSTYVGAFVTITGLPGLQAYAVYNSSQTGTAYIDYYCT